MSQIFGGLPRGVPALVLGSFLLAAPLAAQSAGADESGFEPTPAQQLATAPAPGGWATSTTLGLQIKDGRTETRGYDVDFLVGHTTSGGMLLRLDAEFERAEYRPAQGADRIVVDDKRLASLTAVKSVSGIVGVMAVGSFRRDVPTGLWYRVMGQAGLYFQLVQSPRVNLMVGPLVGTGTQNDARPGSSDGIINLGGVQALSWHLTRTFTVETQLEGHQDLEESDDYSLSFSVSGTAMVAKHVGLKIYYKHQSEGIHADDVGARQHEIGGGLTFTFPNG